MAPKKRAFGTEISANRQSGKELTEVQRSAIVALVENGSSKASVARDFGIHPTTVLRTWQRWQDHNTLKSLPRSPAQKKLSPTAIRNIQRTLRKDPGITWNRVQSECPTPVHISTLRSSLDASYQRKWQRLKRIELDPDKARKREIFALWATENTADLLAV